MKNILKQKNISKGSASAYRRQDGFTLVELMVASSIFAIIMLTAIGALLITINSAKNSRALRFAMDNVNFAMESMTRSIRMGTNYTCVTSGGSLDMTSSPLPQDCGSGDGTFIAFIPQQEGAIDNSMRVGYQATSVLRADGTTYKTLKRYDNSNTGVPVTSSDVSIETLNFTVIGSSPNDDKQAGVYIVMKGTVTVKGVPVPFAIQTMASQRNFQ